MFFFHDVKPTSHKLGEKKQEKQRKTEKSEKPRRKQTKKRHEIPGKNEHSDFRLSDFSGFFKNPRIQDSGGKASDVDFVYVEFPVDSMVIDQPIVAAFIPFPDYGFDGNYFFWKLSTWFGILGNV